jgi:hypothetical protein
MLHRVPLLRTDVSEEFSACRFLQEPHGLTSQKTPFFTAAAVKTSNLTKLATMDENVQYPGHFDFSRCNLCVLALVHGQEAVAVDHVQIGLLSRDSY